MIFPHLIRRLSASTSCGLISGHTNLPLSHFKRVFLYCEKEAFVIEMSTLCIVCAKTLHVSTSRLADDKVVEIPPEFHDYPGKKYTHEWQIKAKGKIYDQKPFKFHCKKDHAYKWCACGLSKSQPFCDNSHDGPLIRSVLKPVTFIAPEDKEYWFCNCKQTDHRPFCDGTHRQQRIQDAIKT